MPFDFDAAVHAPFRMQPGLRRLAAGTPQLTLLPPGCRHQREKLAVLSAFWPQALCATPGFDAAPAIRTLCQEAATAAPGAWQWDGLRAVAPHLGAAVGPGGAVEQTATGSFGVGDEITRCLRGVPPEWRLATLLSLTFAEDLAVVDAATQTIPWLAVALPSHWAPETKVGRPFDVVHGPVADNRLLIGASGSMVRLATGGERRERFVWTITDHPRLHAHPARVAPERWVGTPVSRAWWRTEHQTFLPVGQVPSPQAVFTIHVEVQPLAQALSTPRHAAAVHAAVATMTPAVLAYRGLDTVREPLLAWLAERAGAAPALPPGAPV
jgi:hypothetical protein